VKFLKETYHYKEPFVHWKGSVEVKRSSWT